MLVALRLHRAPCMIRWTTALLAILAVLATPTVHAQDQCVMVDDFSKSTVGAFPDGWKARKDAGKEMYKVAAEGNRRFVHADVTVIMEQPKLAPHLDAMKQRLAEALASAPAHVSVKAKTNEGMGWIGRGEGIAVFAVATLQRGGRAS